MKHFAYEHFHIEIVSGSSTFETSVCEQQNLEKDLALNKFEKPIEEHIEHVSDDDEEHKRYKHAFLLHVIILENEIIRQYIAYAQKGDTTERLKDNSIPGRQNVQTRFQIEPIKEWIEAKDSQIYEKRQSRYKYYGVIGHIARFSEKMELLNHTISAQ
ncbi:hypothetical protein GOP47_0013210 [Adiantum capillus-veneris]|uniref:Uncharacterized protein n=1 Tax=Adiantum capillus-veneris TaxID=13818 RepID=A0A9D4ZD79_ADICA|nr:hypothetical protein GOP47_0013210 [Adiantum capillus-veneris]